MTAQADEADAAAKGAVSLLPPPFQEGARRAKEMLKGMTIGGTLFEELGFSYIGPVDGHDLAAMEQALTNARNFGGPVIVHAITEKGHGYLPARLDENDQFHSVPVIDPETGKPTGTASARTWTHVFRDEIAAIAGKQLGVRAGDVAVFSVLLPADTVPATAEFTATVAEDGRPSPASQDGAGLIAVTVATVLAGAGGEGPATLMEEAAK